MKHELSITKEYQPKWGFWEGIREIVCNGQDAEKEFGAPLNVDFRVNNSIGTLRVENEGCIIPRESAFLLGMTSKAGRSDTIGQFGEGFKIGILALIRAGATVKVRNGEAVWTASIEPSKKGLNADVLMFDEQGGRKFENRVRVEIGNLDPIMWDRLKSKFLWLQRPKKDEVVVTSQGELLRGEAYRGQLFVKGVYIRKMGDYEFGYNLYSGQLNRDRDLLDQYDLQIQTRRIWEEAVLKDPTMMVDMFRMLQDGVADLAGINEYSTSYVKEEVRKQVTEEFLKRNPGAIPVRSLSESRELEHVGRIGAVVPRSLQSLLSLDLGSFDTVMASAKEEVTVRYGWHDLPDETKAVLERAMDLLGAVRPQWTLDLVDVVDFRTDDLLGLHKEGRVYVAKKMLDSVRNTLRVLVHEFAHFSGGDGDKGHVRASEDAWADVVAYLLNNK